MNILSTDSEYYLKYDLSRDPFPLTTIDKDIYLTPELEHRIEKIKALITDSSKLVVVTSSMGAGKTVLSGHLQSLKETDWMVARVNAKANTGIDSLACMLIEEIFPERSFDESESVSQLHKFLESSDRNGKRPVFIIDDAHQLPPETMEFVLQLSELRHNETRFRIVLFGDESIHDQLDDPKLSSLAADNLYPMYIPSFTQKQTKAYINHRLTQCGQPSEYPFKDEDFQRIYKIAGGLPAGINHLARQIMQEHASIEAKQPRFNRQSLGLIAAIVLLMILCAYLLFAGDSGKRPEEKTTDIAIAIPPAQSLLETQDVRRMESSDTLKKKAIPEEPPARISVPVVSEPAVQKNIPSKISKAPVKAREEPETKPPVEPASVEKTEQQQPEKVEIATAEVIKKPPPREARPEPVVKPEPVKRPVTGNTGLDLRQVTEIFPDIKGSDWLRQQPGKSYVLQLMSAKEIDNVRRFLDKQPGIRRQLSGYTNYTPSGKPRYLLFYGLYPSNKSASAAARELKTRLRNVEPWPRPVSNIIKQLNELSGRGYGV